VFRPDIGYVQGMSFIAGSFLMHSGDEVTAFKSFANAMNKEILYNFYLFDMPKVNVLFHVYTRLLEDKLPKLANMFN
jgi:TBC1 domain family member 14